jgi:hypothetical protein
MRIFLIHSYTQTLIHTLLDSIGQLKFPQFRKLLKDDELGLNYNHIQQLEVRCGVV